MMSDGIQPTHSQLEAFAEQLRLTFLNKPFGIIRFFGFAMVRANDQSYLLTDVSVDSDRLDLTFIQEGGSGAPGILSVWNPEGLIDAPESIGVGMAIQSATRLRMDEGEATLDGSQFRLKTARGEGLWPLKDGPALILAR